MQHINLVDASLLPPQRLLSAHKMLGLLSFAAAAVALHGAFEQQRLTRVLALAHAAPAATEVANALGEAVPDSAAMLELQHRIAQRQRLLQAVGGSAAPAHDTAEILQRVMAALPESAWLTELELHGARGLRVAGGVLEPTALGVFAERLAQTPALRGLPIETLRLTFEAGSAGSSEGIDSAATAAPHHRFVLANPDATAQEAAR